MKLSGLHLLLTYQCTLECDHCFVWGSSWQSGTLTLKNIHHILQQAKELGTIEWIYFEGGEPFLYYAVLIHGVKEAAGAGFRVGIVSNGYWATSIEDALEWLSPLAGLIEDLCRMRRTMPMPVIYAIRPAVPYACVCRRYLRQIRCRGYLR